MRKQLGIYKQNDRKKDNYKNYIKINEIRLCRLDGRKNDTNIRQKIIKKGR